MFRRAKGADAGERLLRRDRRQRGDAAPDARPDTAADDTTAADGTTDVVEEMPPAPGRRRRRGRSEAVAESPPLTDGPFDSADVTSAELAARLDLGSLRLAMREGMELRVQVDEASQDVVGVIGLWPDSAVELRAFAAPKTSAIWDDVRAEILADAASNGGTAVEVDGLFGVELHLNVQVADESGRQTMQAQRLWGIDGPRWFLRVNVVGRAAVDDGELPEVEAFVRDIVVVRGREAMAPRDALPVKLPELDTKPDTDTDLDAQTPEGVEGEQHHG
jgi:hypothetical protein